LELIENFCHQGIENPKIVILDQGRPSTGARGGDPDHRGKVPIKKSQARGSDFRDIGDPMDKGSGKSIVKTPIHPEPSIHQDRWQNKEPVGISHIVILGFWRKRRN
jgi:hypothetical protein